MDACEQHTDQSRDTMVLDKERGTRGTPDYLRLLYVVPNPPTLAELGAAERDFNRRWEAGERTGPTRSTTEKNC